VIGILNRDLDDRLSSSQAFMVFILFLLVCASPFIASVIWKTEFFEQGGALNWIFMALVLLFICGIAGFGLRGKWFAAIIDQRNMLSLSQIQLMLWGILLVSTYLTLSSSKIAYGISHPFDIKIPGPLWIIFGTITASLIVSLLIKKDNSRSNVLGENAKISDLFRGEEVGNYFLPDLGKIQLFLFTTIVWVAYAVMVYRLINDVPANFDFPEMSGGMSSLLVISNASYLAYKAVPRELPPEKRTTKTTKPIEPVAPGKTMDLSQLGIYLIEMLIICAILYSIVAFPMWLRH
jgi:hypothetical protein